MKSTAIKVHATPVFSFVMYKGNQEQGTFQKILGRPDQEKLPFELIIERTYRPEIIKADSIIRDIHYSKGNGKFFSGLRASPIVNFYTGDIRESDGKRSQIIIYINPNLSELMIWYYPKYIFFPIRLNKEVNRISQTFPK